MLSHLESSGWKSHEVFFRFFVVISLALDPIDRGEGEGVRP